ncbi:PHP domain-containing protein [Vallitalea pronyensis]|uniref:PHP domain-containing protein n=1 Tax=Vallitalea pronyensis TaxID=1348613 RepID=A0A8J8MLI7_9FIRM|nr:PHP domain-containing protein [Vallitalea pronyensis]QUI23721.1 PHP domain-containing protein [Vallitalea pronyensis]
MNRYIDLHTHTTISDGTMTPRELIEYAAKKKLAAIAITDHDSIDGIWEAKQSGKKNHVEVISGIEFSTYYKHTEIHIIGLLIDEKDKRFIKGLHEIIEARDNRNKVMVDKLQAHGFNINLDDIFATADSKVYTRAHMARAMLNKGYVSSMKEAFDLYIGNDGPCYVSREKVNPQMAIQLIRSCGGVSILAHPTLYDMNLRELDALIKELKAIGLQGIEGEYALYTKSEERYIKELAKAHDLVLSGGSDFHGDNKPYIDLGVGKGNLKINYHLLERMREIKNH